MKKRSNNQQKIENEWSKMGHPAETISLLFLVPLVQVAWAEGFVQTTERKAILRLAADLKINEEHAGYKELLGWLEMRPTDEFFDEANKLLRAWLETLEPVQVSNLRNILLIGCLEVARASEGIGLQPKKMPICPEERRKLEHLGNQFGFSPTFAF